jgi:hypothetical protein
MQVKGRLRRTTRLFVATALQGGLLSGVGKLNDQLVLVRFGRCQEHLGYSDAAYAACAVHVFQTQVATIATFVMSYTM